MTAAVVEQPVSTPIKAEKPAPPPLTSHPLVASTDQKALLSSLAVLVSALPTRPPMQVLLGIRVTADTNGLHLGAFDYEVSVTDTIAGSGEGEALIPGRLLSDMVKSLDPGPVTLTVQGDNVLLAQDDLTYTIPLLPLADYPALPDTSSVPLAFQLTGAELKHLNRVTVAAGRDDTLPVLTGVRLEITGESVTSAATDRYRLGVATLPIKGAIETEALIPGRTFAFATKHFGKADTVEVLTEGVRKGQGLVVLRSGSLQLTSRLLEGEFPKYRSLIPAPETAAAVSTFDSTVLSKGVKQVAIAAARNAPVRLALGESNTIEAGGADDARAAKKIPGEFTGKEDIAIAFNPAYLLDGIAAVTGKAGRVRVDMVTSTRPAILTDVEDVDRSFLYLLMPVRLSG